MTRRRLATCATTVVIGFALTALGLLTGQPATARGAAATTAMAASAAQQSVFRWKGQLAAGRTIEVKGVNGDVSAEPSTGSDVEVTAEKRGRRSNPDEVEIKVVEHAGGVTICAVYPSSDAVRPNICEPGSGGRMSTRNNDVKVDFKVRVPAGVRFNGQTVNGSIEAESLGAEVKAYTVNGSIKLSTSGYAEAATVNGSINASLGNDDWSNELEFSTVNGDINLSLPADASTEVRASTVNGDITTDFPITTQGVVRKRRLNGTIGAGGRELELKTVNGGVRLRRAS